MRQILWAGFLCCASFSAPSWALENPAFKPDNSFFLRGDTGQTYLFTKPLDSKGGFTKVTWGLHDQTFYHGLTGVMRRVYNFKVHDDAPLSYHLESEAVGFDEEIHWHALILGGALEGGRLVAMSTDFNQRYSFAGASLYTGFTIFANRFLHFSFKVGGFYYRGDRDWQKFAEQASLSGTTISFGMNLNDSGTNANLGTGT